MHDCELFVMCSTDDPDEFQVCELPFAFVASCKAHIAFHSSGGRSRGHFSRMFSLREWSLHKNNFNEFQSSDERSDQNMDDDSSSIHMTMAQVV